MRFIASIATAIPSYSTSQLIPPWNLYLTYLLHSVTLILLILFNSTAYIDFFLLDGSNVTNIKDRRRNSLKEIRKSSVFLLNNKSKYFDNDNFIESLQSATLAYHIDSHSILKPGQIVSGWLEKRRNKKWSTRYMILEKDRIVYYKQIDGPVQGTIMLDNCTIRVSDEQYTIEVINSSRDSSKDRYTIISFISFFILILILSLLANTKSSFLCLPMSSMTAPKKKSVFLKFQDEKQLTMWLMLLKCINRSYLDNRKTDDIRIINHSFRTVWLNVKNKYDETVLHTLAKQKPSTTENAYDFIIRQMELIIWFCDNGCPIDAQDVDGNSPLLLALKKKNIDAANTLIMKGASVELANNHFESSASILNSYNNQKLPLWNTISNEKSHILVANTVSGPNQIRGYTYLSINIRKIRYGGKAVFEDVESFASEISFNNNINTNPKQKLSKRLSIMMDDTVDDDVDGSSITHDARLSVSVLNKSTNEIENNVKITNHPIIAGRRHDDCNSILFSSRWNMMTPLEVIDEKTSVVFTIEKDPLSSSEDVEDRFFKLDLAVKVILLH